MMDYPFVVFALFLVPLWLAVRIGTFVRRKHPEMDEGQREDLGVILAATLTLLGLIIGFSFSMAVSRYDQRKNYEEAEANAIGTEYVRADLLPADNAAKVKALLKKYLDQRILFYTAHDSDRIERINNDTAQLQADLWVAVQGPATAKPEPVIALAVAGMNDVLNSQGYTQAAWWNRIPAAAWAMMAAIALCSNLLLGYGARRGPETEGLLLLVLPLIVSITFFIIADIDSPRSGVIRVQPQNLISLSQSLGPH